MDLHIRDVPGGVADRIDAKAKQAGLTRAEYLRRLLERHAAVPSIEEVDAQVAAAGLTPLSPEEADRAWAKAFKEKRAS